MPSPCTMPSARKAPAGPATPAVNSGFWISAASSTRASSSPPAATSRSADPVELVDVVAHRLLEPDRQRKEVLVDAVDRDRSGLGDAPHQRLELAERGVALLPGGARGAVLGPGALVGLARDQAREALDLLGRARPCVSWSARARSTTTDQFDPAAFGTARWSARPGRPNVRRIAVDTVTGRSPGSRARARSEAQPRQLVLPRRDHREEVLPPAAILADPTGSRRRRPRLLVEGGPEVVLEDLGGAARIRDRGAHRRERLERRGRGGVELVRGEQREDAARGLGVEGDRDRRRSRRERCCTALPRRRTARARAPAPGPPRAARSRDRGSRRERRRALIAGSPRRRARCPRSPGRARRASRRRAARGW